VNDVLSWMNETSKILLAMTASRAATSSTRHHSPSKVGPSDPAATPTRASSLFRPVRSNQQYLKDISTCHELIKSGESYELCLTNALKASNSEITALTAYDIYKQLRTINPSPYGAYLQFGDTLGIACSSPERFLRVESSGKISSKPIKGTSPRSPDPSIDALLSSSLKNDVKNRAENLMIVDLVRNDLGRVCQIGSVNVEKLFNVESYATVHQMVSTISGKLQNHQSAIDGIAACFPGGSMTGAPKLRTMEFLHDLEQGRKRGVYSGSIGYISPNDVLDLNIVIRTAIVTGKDDESKVVSIGCGGAITALSESDDELDEMMLKAKAIVDATELAIMVKKKNNGRTDDTASGTVHGKESSSSSNNTM